MIANEDELAVVCKQLHDLKARRDRMGRDRACNDFQLHVEMAGVDKMIARLQEEVDTYQSAKPSEVASAR